MAEYLKNNPVALRHCLLYEYLQKNAYSRAFTNFRDTIGIDVFSEEELRSFFSQFRKRKMEGENGPITDMKDVLRNDKHALRACILYESLKYKLAERGYSTQRLWPRSFFQLHEIRHNPSFALHSNFCEKLGENVMAYPEFDFWFHRFVNEEFDLNFEREKDKKIYELVGMPLDITRSIVEYLNVFDRLALAQTSHSFKTFVEDQKLFGEKLEFQLHHQSAEIQFQKRSTKMRVYAKGLYSQNRKLTKSTFYWKRAFMDLKNILKHPKLQIKQISFSLFKYHEPSEEEVKVVDKAISKLELPLKHLNIEHFVYNSKSMQTLLKILPFLKPGYLTTIDIKNNSYPQDRAMINELVAMEQWKQAKYLTMRTTTYFSSVFHFYHFKEFYIRLVELPVEDIRQMKEILFNSPDFEKCKIEVHIPLDMNDIGHEFGDAIQGRPNIYHYPIPNSTEYFEIELELGSIRITRKNE